jgi:hypothetical protein
MTQSEIASVFKRPLMAIGYDEERIRRNYEFSDLSGTAAHLRRIPLAAFSGYPQSYRNACVGVIVAADHAAAAPDDFCALGAPLLLTVKDDMVQPWAIGLEGART